MTDGFHCVGSSIPLKLKTLLSVNYHESPPLLWSVWPPRSCIHPSWLIQQVLSSILSNRNGAPCPLKAAHCCPSTIGDLILHTINLTIFDSGLINQLILFLSFIALQNRQFLLSHLVNSYLYKSNRTIWTTDNTTLSRSSQQDVECCTVNLYISRTFS